MRVLVTGFGPFGDVSRNASAEIADDLRVPGIDVLCLILAVKWNVAPESAMRAVRDFAPDVVLMNGVAQSRQPLWIERGATSLRDGVDVDGVAPQKIPRGVRALTIDVRAAARAARATWSQHDGVGDILRGVRIRPVRTTNVYLCNHVAYEVAGSLVGARCGFLHWPSELGGAGVAVARAMLASVILSQR